MNPGFYWIQIKDSALAASVMAYWNGSTFEALGRSYSPGEVVLDERYKTSQT